MCIELNTKEACLCSNGFELVGVAKHYVFDLGLRYPVHGCDDFNGLPLLLLLDLLLVLFGLVVELFYYLVLDLLLALVVEAETGTLLGILAATLAAGVFLLGFLGLQPEQLLVDPQASRLVELFKLHFVGEALLAGAAEELPLEEISAVGVEQGCGVGVRGTLGLPINLP